MGRIAEYFDNGIDWETSGTLNTIRDVVHRPYINLGLNFPLGSGWASSSIKNLDFMKNWRWLLNGELYSYRILDTYDDTSHVYIRLTRISDNKAFSFVNASTKTHAVNVPEFNVSFICEGDFETSTNYIKLTGAGSFPEYRHIKTIGEKIPETKPTNPKACNGFPSCEGTIIEELVQAGGCFSQDGKVYDIDFNWNQTYDEALTKACVGFPAYTKNINIIKKDGKKSSIQKFKHVVNENIFSSESTVKNFITDDDITYRFIAISNQDTNQTLPRVDDLFHITTAAYDAWNGINRNRNRISHLYNSDGANGISNDTYRSVFTIPNNVLNNSSKISLIFKLYASFDASGQNNCTNALCQFINAANRNKGHNDNQDWSFAPSNGDVNRTQIRITIQKNSAGAWTIVQPTNVDTSVSSNGLWPEKFYGKNTNINSSDQSTWTIENTTLFRLIAWGGATTANGSTVAVNFFKDGDSWNLTLSPLYNQTGGEQGTLLIADPVAIDITPNYY